MIVTRVDRTSIVIALTVCTLQFFVMVSHLFELLRVQSMVEMERHQRSCHSGLREFVCIHILLYSHSKSILVY